VVSPNAWPAHYRLLLDGVRNRLDELSDYRLDARFEEVSDMRDGIDFLRAVRVQIDAGVNGLILAPGDYPPERRRLLWEMLRAAHIPFVLLGMNESGHEVSPHLAVVEQDSRMCGRWAAELLALMTPDLSRCAILAGSTEIRDHALKIAAFREELTARNRPEPAVAENRDLPELAEVKTLELLERYPDLGGIYVATENVPGVESALARAGKTGAVRIVATGISPHVLDGIAAGRIQASISQQEPLQGRKAVDILFQYLETGCRPPLENPIAPRIVMRSNLELFRSV
jgi:ABC-type sugar transport system substrate-binding protein